MANEKRAEQLMKTAYDILAYMVKRAKERKMSASDGIAALATAYALGVATSSEGDVETARKKHEKVWELITTAPTTFQQRAIDVMRKAEEEADANG